MSVLSSLSVCILCLSYTLFHVCVFVKIKKKCLSSVLHIASSICLHPPKSIYSRRFSYHTKLVVAVRIITCVHTINFMPCLLVVGGRGDIVLLFPAKFEFIILDLLLKYMYMYHHPISWAVTLICIDLKADKLMYLLSFIMY